MPDGGTGGGTPDGGPGGAPLTCADEDLGSALPVRRTGTLRSASSAPLPTCSSGDTEGAAVRTFTWRAPYAGTFVFDTATSAFDTVLAARRGTCGGPELTCNDDFISYGGTSELRVTLAAGEPVVLTLGGRNGAEQGYFALHVSALAASESGAACFDWADGDGDGRVDCADADCRAQPGCGGSGCADGDLGMRESASVSGTTAGGGNRFEGTCTVFKAQQDRAYTWTAPRAGQFVVDSAGSQTGVALYVLTGCRGEELACGRIVYTAGDPNKTTSVVFDARAGQTLLLVVDGQRGPDSGPREEIPVEFRLNVHPLGVEQGAACSNGVDDDADGYPDGRDADCGGPGEPW